MNEKIMDDPKTPKTRRRTKAARIGVHKGDDGRKAVSRAGNVQLDLFQWADNRPSAQVIPFTSPDADRLYMSLVLRRLDEGQMQRKPKAASVVTLKRAIG